MNEESEIPLACGTGFTCKGGRGADWFLITNWHCVTGRHAETNNPISSNGYCDPEIVKVHFHASNKPNTWIEKIIKLKDENGKSLWIEHDLGSKIDIVVVPITLTEEISLYNLSDAVNGPRLLSQPSDSVSIIGFPNGLTGSQKFPIWKTGNIATDYCVDWNNYPLFLIDATTRRGMSGAPVVMIKEGLCRFEGENLMSGRYLKFMGVYSGRIDDNIEIGRVWKPQALFEILDKYYQ